MGAIWVTAYVPCYNGSRWLARCLQALADQTVPPDELLVIDDGSTDDSAAIAARLGAHVIRHETNRGLAVARNTALTHACGDLLAAVDADVAAEPDWLARLLDCFDSPRVGCAGGMLRERHVTRAADLWRALHLCQHQGTTRLVNPPSIVGANTVFLTAALREVGGYNEQYRTTHEDIDVHRRVRGAGYDTIYEPAAVAYHLRTDSVTTVLATCERYGYLPYELRGQYDHEEGLCQKLFDTVHTLRQHLAFDEQIGVRIGAPYKCLAYITLLALLRTLLTDLRRARQRAEGRGTRAMPAATPTAEAALRRHLLSAIGTRQPALAPLLTRHLDRSLAGIPSALAPDAAVAEGLPDPLPKVLHDATLALGVLSDATWRDLPAAAQVVDAEWEPDEPDVVPAPTRRGMREAVALGTEGLSRGGRASTPLPLWR